MKLHELKSPQRHLSEIEVEIDPIGSYVGPILVKVVYDLSSGGSTSHGSGSSFREYHDDDLYIDSATTVEEVEEYDEDGQVEKTHPPGTKVSKLTGWGSKDDALLLKLAYEAIQDEASKHLDSEY